ncbi:hypothetical protein J5X84_29715 [Streptosporangiaceae bacterium NEAU-GS5]|nr:hypothetical protein [Streptosporangiaceae bacterium NEAU-GS5]
MRRAVLLLLLMAAALVFTGGARSADAAPVSGLVVDQITPEVPREPRTPVLISGSVTGSPGTSVRLRLRYSPGRPLSGRDELASYAAGEGYTSSWVTKIQATALDGTGKLPFQIQVTPHELGISRLGVYPLSIEVLDGTTDQQLAINHTVLTFIPKDAQLKRTRIAVALPLIERPHRADDDTFMDDDLPASLSSGRLAELLSLVNGVNGVTWFVDPALLADAERLTRSHTLRKGSSETTKPGDPAAGKWLADLKTALADRPVIATPYADPDIEALIHKGLDGPAAAALTRGASVATALLGRQVGTSVVWPAGGALDRDALDELSVHKVDRVLLSADRVSSVGAAAAPIDAVGGQVTAVLTDPVLDGALSADVSQPGAAARQRQLFLAETALLAQDGVPAVVMAPLDRLWTPDPAYVTGLLKTAATVPWLRLTGLDTIKPAPGAPVIRDLLYSTEDQQAELGRTILSGVRKLHTHAEVIAAVTGSKAPVFDDAVMRLASASWRGGVKTGQAFVRQVTRTVDERLRKISLSKIGRIVVGTNGRLPIAIDNNLVAENEPVTVKIRVTADNPAVLRIADGGVFESERITVSPRRAQTVTVPVTVTGSGDTTIRVQLLTPDDRPYGDPVPLPVQATGYTGVTLIIVGAGLTIMLAAVVMRVLRRRSRPALSPRTEEPVLNP